MEYIKKNCERCAEKAKKCYPIGHFQSQILPRFRFPPKWHNFFPLLKAEKFFRKTPQIITIFCLCVEAAWNKNAALGCGMLQFPLLYQCAKYRLIAAYCWTFSAMFCCRIHAAEWYNFCYSTDAENINWSRRTIELFQLCSATDYLFSVVNRNRFYYLLQTYISVAFYKGFCFRSHLVAL